MAYRSSFFNREECQSHLINAAVTIKDQKSSIENT